MTGIPTGSFERKAVARATAFRRLLCLGFSASLLMTAGCTRPQPAAPGAAAPSTVTTSIAAPATVGGADESAAKSAASDAASASAAARDGAPIPGEVAMGDAEDIRDLARDELEGYTAGPLEKTEYELRRTYKPEDPGAFREIAVVVRRFRSARAVAEAADQLASKGTDRQRVQVSGLDGRASMDGSHPVLLLPNGRVLLELEISGSAPDTALRAQLKDVAEALLD